MNRRRWHLLTVAVGVTLTVTAVGAGNPAPAAVQPCSTGLITLTFDDGPSVDVTPRLLEVLRGRRVPATFFVVGQRVDAAPWITRRTSAYGFKVANHSYAHEQLTTLSSTRVANSLRRTRRSIVDSGARPSNLMRAPYGAIDRRVHGVVADVGMRHVGWQVDPQDWEGYSGPAIASRVLRLLRPDRRNVVLLHDGIGNSPNTLRSVPTIVREGRARGYCFASLDAHGRPQPPVPQVRVSDAKVTERDLGEHAAMRFVLTLNAPTSRVTSVRLRTVDGTAAAGGDYRARDLRVRFPVGVTRAVVTVVARGDRIDETNEHFRVRLSDPRGLRLRDARGTGRITDNDAPVSAP